MHIHDTANYIKEDSWRIAMIDLLIITSYILMMALPMFAMLVMEHYSEERWEEKHHKRLLHILHYKGKIRKKEKPQHR